MYLITEQQKKKIQEKLSELSAYQYAEKRMTPSEHEDTDILIDEIYQLEEIKDETKEHLAGIQRPATDKEIDTKHN